MSHFSHILQNLSVSILNYCTFLLKSTMSALLQNDRSPPQQCLNRADEVFMVSRIFGHVLITHQYKIDNNNNKSDDKNSLQKIIISTLNYLSKFIENCTASDTIHESTRSYNAIHSSLTLACVGQMLKDIHEFCIDFDVAQENASTMQVVVADILNKVIRFKSVASTEFKTEIRLWIESDNCARLSQANIHCSLGVDVATQLSTYGKYLDNVLSRRWECISESMSILVSIGRHHSDIYTTSFFVDLLASTSNEVDSATCNSIPSILNSVRSMGQLWCKFIQSKDDSDCNVICLQLETVIRASWNVILGDNDAVSTCLGPFIETCFDTSSLRILSCEFQQV
jgi:hypothetical protein